MESSDTTPPRGGNSEGDGGERVKEAARNAAADARRQARSTLEKSKDSATVAADDATEALDEAGSRLAERGHQTLAQAAYAASEKISEFARYVETHSVDELTREARRIARSNPALLAAGGMVLGFALSRFFKASSEHQYGMSSGPARAYESGAGDGPYRSTGDGSSTRQEQSTEELQ